MRSRAGWGALAACALALSACGGGRSGGGGGSGGSSAQVKGAKDIDVKSMESTPKGTIKYCQGKDTTGAGHAIVDEFNKKFGSQGYKAPLTEFPASADQQRAQFIQLQQAKS